MSKSLVIVESPAKARTISKILPSQYKITASMGHVRDLPQKDFGIDIDNNFEPTYEVTPSRKKVITELKAEAKKADAIYLATDPDREGEAIAWHIYELLKKQNKKAVFHRVTFHEITKPAVLAAFDHAGEVDMDLVDAQQARRILDRLVGYQVSPLLWKAVEPGTSAGRVQSVALRLIVEREREIVDFKPEEYWNLLGHFEKTATRETFAAKLAQIDGDKAVVSSGEHANKIADDTVKGDWYVSSVTKKPRKRRPSPPFITSTLQQAASSNLRMSPNQSMRVAQQLYEGIEKSSAPAGGLITYMRTDSFNVSKEAQGAARDFIGKEFGNDFVPKKPNSYRSRGGAQEAHEAIRPTDIFLTPKRAAAFLDSQQSRLYALIWNRFMASQMAPAQQLRYTIEVMNREGSCQHLYTFRASATTTTFPGYLQVYNMHDTEDEKDEEDGEFPLPELTKGDAAILKSLDRDQKFTEPPPRFSEAMLVKELEKNGVGRPSTYASIINTIQQRKYVEKEKGKLAPTKRGFDVNDYLIRKMPSLFDVTFTASMEDKLDNIENGKQEWHEMIQKFYDSFADWVLAAKEDGPEIPRAKQLLEAIPVEDVKWNEPEKRGKRTYDDKKYVNSLHKNFKGKRFSERQWFALIRLCFKYGDQLKGIEKDLDATTKQEFAELRRQAEEKAKETPSEGTLKMIEALNGVNEWQPPVTRGKRTYNDKEFFESLKGQAESGRKLTPNQVKALGRIVAKYHEQIPNFDELKEQVVLPKAKVMAEVEESVVTATFKLADEIKDWDPPSGKGRRKFDDKEFITDVAGRYAENPNLTDRQWKAVQKVIAKYGAQIDDYANRAAELGLPPVGGKPGDKVTDVTCPKCGKGKLAQRGYRGRTFYGCNKYPKCDYTSNSIDELAPVEKDEKK